MLIAELTSRGYSVSVPVVDGPYDLLVERSKGFLRVQVKSTSTQGERTKAYQCVIRKGRNKKYDPANVDIAAVYVEPEKVWYFIPMSLLNVATVYLFPNEKKGKFDTYENYWKVFDL